MEDEYSKEYLPGMHSIYRKGGPFYKLSNKEYSPSMNILKTFDVENPQCTDIHKDMASNAWSSNSFEAFFLILRGVEKFSGNSDFTFSQVAAVYEIFYSSFKFLMFMPALRKERFLEYFRETLLLYCYQDPPEALRIFNGIQAFAIAKLFHNLFENNFEMMQYVLLAEYTVEFDVVKDL